MVFSLSLSLFCLYIFLAYFWFIFKWYTCTRDDFQTSGSKFTRSRAVSARWGTVISECDDVISTLTCTKSTSTIYPQVCFRSLHASHTLWSSRISPLLLTQTRVWSALFIYVWSPRNWRCFWLGKATLFGSWSKQSSAESKICWKRGQTIGRRVSALVCLRVVW